MRPQREIGEARSERDLRLPLVDVYVLIRRLSTIIKHSVNMASILLPGTHEYESSCL